MSLFINRSLKISLVFITLFACNKVSFAKNIESEISENNVIEKKINKNDSIPKPEEFIKKDFFKDDINELDFSYVDESGSVIDNLEPISQKVHISMTDKQGNSKIFNSKLEVIEEREVEDSIENFAVKLTIERSSNDLLSGDILYKTQNEILETLIKKNEIKFRRSDNKVVARKDIIGVEGIASNQIGKLNTIFLVNVDGEIQKVLSPTTVYGVQLREEVTEINPEKGSTLHLQYTGIYYQNIDFVLDANRIVEKTNKRITNGYNYEYTWVKDQKGTPVDFLQGIGPFSLTGRHVEGNTYPDKLTDGFNDVFMKVTDYQAANDTQIIPIKVFNEVPNFKRVSHGEASKEYAIKVIDKETKKFPYLDSRDIIRKDKAEIDNLLSEKLEFELWDYKKGEKIENQEVKFLESSIQSDTNRGQEDIKVRIEGEDNIDFTIPRALLVVSSGVIKEFGDLSTWETIYLMDYDARVKNRVNGSELGLMNRGIRAIPNNTIGYDVLDKNGKSMVYQDGLYTTAMGISIDNKILYSEGPTTNSTTERPVPVWEATKGFSRFPYYNEWRPENTNYSKMESVEIFRELKTFYYLKKDNKLLQIMVDNENQVTYTRLMELKANATYNFSFKAYNNNIDSRKFILIEMVDTYYYTDRVPIYSLGRNRGFELRPPLKESGNEQMLLTIKLKDNNGRDVSDFVKYNVGLYTNVTLDPFGKSGKESGKESPYDEKGRELTKKVLISGQYMTEDSGYALGTNELIIPFDESINGGYELFLGKEFDYLGLNITPERKPIYQDQWKDGESFKATVSKMHPEMKNGVMEFTYPNNVVEKTNFTKPTGGTTSTITHKINRNNLPTRLNDTPGTVKEYPIKVVGVNYTEDDILLGLPTDEKYYNLDVYNLGALPIPKEIKKGGTFTEKPSAAIDKTTEVILPGHKAKYVYYHEGKEFESISNASQIGLDVNKVGAQYIYVKMYDVEETAKGKERSTIIRVPVQIYENTPPGGIIVDGQDFKLSDGEVDKYWSQRELHNFILERSNAVGYDASVKPPSLKDVEVSVVSTTLPYEPQVGNTYEAYIKATKGNQESEVKKINISYPKKLEAKANAQTIAIGDNKIDYHTFVKDVTSEGIPINRDEYEVKLSDSSVVPDVITKENQPTEVLVDVMLIGDESSLITVKVPITTIW